MAKNYRDVFCLSNCAHCKNLGKPIDEDYPRRFECSCYDGYVSEDEFRELKHFTFPLEKEVEIAT